MNNKYRDRRDPFMIIEVMKVYGKSRMPESYFNKNWEKLSPDEEEFKTWKDAIAYDRVFSPIPLLFNQLTVVQ